MHYVTVTDAKRRFAVLLNAAQGEPVVIRRRNRDVAVILSTEEYDRLRGFNVAEFQRFCKRVVAKAASRGLTVRKFQRILRD
jgi:prevent-host-death family protein